MTLLKLNRPYVGFRTTPTVNSLMENLFKNDFWGEEYAGFVPSVNVAETDNGFEMEVSAPGFEKENFKVEVEKNILTISGEHKMEESKTEKNFTRKEFSYGSFKRTFTLPESANTENINAKYDKGILKIEIAKHEQAKVKPIKEIKIS